MPPRILVVEDQEDINALIAMNLTILNYEVVRCDNGVDGLKLASDNQQKFDLIILDIMLPGMDGLQVCQNLRANGVLTPIMMLTAKKTEAERVVGLEIGADDYLTKPFSVLELQARAKALLRRVSFLNQEKEKQEKQRQIEGTVLNLGPLQINEEKRLVTIDGKPVNLTAKEFDLLLYLAKYPGQVFSREQLLSAIWGYEHSGYEHTVNSHINRLRAKIEADPTKPKFVLTVWGVGYKFNDQ